MLNDDFLNVYKKYLHIIEVCTNEQLPNYFVRFSTWLNDNRSEIENELYSNSVFASAYEALEQVEKRGINLKEKAKRWDSSSIKTFFRILESVETIEHENSFKAIPKLEQYKVQLYRLLKFIREEEDSEKLS